MLCLGTELPCGLEVGVPGSNWVELNTLLFGISGVALIQKTVKLPDRHLARQLLSVPLCPPANR